MSIDPKREAMEMFMVYVVFLAGICLFATNLWQSLASFNFIFGLIMVFGGISGAKHQRNHQDVAAMMVIFGLVNLTSCVVVRVALWLYL